MEGYTNLFSEEYNNSILAIRKKALDLDSNKVSIRKYFLFFISFLSFSFYLVLIG